MNRKRLRDLVRVLRGVPRKLFDMGRFSDCGTGMCAAGHYMAAFPRRKLVRDRDGMPRTQRETEPFSALAEHFGMTERVAGALFVPSYNDRDTPKSVARRFEKYLKTGEVPA